MNPIHLPPVLAVWLAILGSNWGSPPAGAEEAERTIRASIPTLNTDNATLDEAFRIAVGDLLGNVVPYKDGLLDQPVPVIHPITGKIYGGLQENGGRGIVLWPATSRQTWAATAYLRMVLLGLAGLRFDADGVRFQPCLPSGISRVELRNVNYRRMNLDLTIRGTGTAVEQCLINAREAKDGLLGAAGEGRKQITIGVNGRR
ncbi:MAG: glycosyl hydrolase family 65 protein [Thermoguttaceae bacterium]|jgi:hypothetical protein